MLDLRIIDGTGTERRAIVDDQSGLVVSVNTSPPIGVQKNKIFRGYLTSSAGATDMRVNGSVTNVDFSISASNTADRYITQLSFIIADAGASLNTFGNLAALTNGCFLYYNRLGEIVTIHNALKSNWDFVRLCSGQPAFGATTNAFIASNVFGLSEGVIPVLDLTKMLPPYGIKLDQSSTQTITLTVRDNCTGVDQFDCIAYGFDRLAE
ncbi:MAG: hypothetical protein Q8S44_10545 [Flavobacteriaceae bacterium]|nr:hypothetical protein [Flavobacteriaceae bacterium]